MSNVIKSSRVSLGEKKLINFDAIRQFKQMEPENQNESTSLAEIESMQKKMMEEAGIQAQALIEKAHKEAEEIINQARQEAEAQKNQIFEQSHQSGYEMGYEEGRLQAEQLKNQAKQIVEDAKDQKQQIILDIEPQMIDLITSIIQKLLSDTIELNPDTILYLIRKGLDHIAETSAITIKVSQDDYPLVMEREEEILNFIDQGTDFHIARDANLQKGDCIIDTSFGSIDCSLQEQLNGIKKELYHIMNSQE